MEIKKEHKIFECKPCDYVCSRKFNYDKHILTLKHKNSIMEMKKEQILSCSNCGKEYKTTSGKWKHEKTCKVATRASIMNVLTANKELSQLLVKHQVEHQQTQERLLDHIKEQQKQIKELIPRIGNVTNQFNITVFLNDQCKEAVNWDDFLRTLQICDPAPESVMKLICDGIEDLGMYKRPIHCIDAKRNRLCIRNENVWQQETTQVQETIRHSNRILQEKCIGLLKQWEEEHPEWHTNEVDTEAYMEFVNNVMTEIDPKQCSNELAEKIHIH